MNEVVLSGPLLLAAAVAALAGLVSFASPCVLPLVPGFLGYVGGMTSAADTSRRRLVLGAALFVAGFTAVFLAMSVVISGVGLALTEHQGLLLRLAGVVDIAEHRGERRLVLRDGEVDRRVHLGADLGV